MTELEREAWREKARLCAVARGLRPTRPAGNMGWFVKEGVQEYAFQPMTNGGQCYELIVWKGLCVQCERRSRRVGNTRRSVLYWRWRVRRCSGLYFSPWYEDLNMSVVDYIADQGGKMKYRRGVRKKHAGEVGLFLKRSRA